jgi:hypothetical protein
MAADPCSPPDSWRRPPVARGGGALAACGDTPEPPAIDVAALSVGQPDGTYYAGKRLLPWLSFEDRCRIVFRDDRRAPPENEALLAHRAGETVVVRWTIEGGIPSAPDPFPNRYREGNEREYQRAFIWGTEPRHVDVYQLSNALLRDVIPDGQERPGAEGYHDAVAKLTREFGDAWILPALAIRRIAARLDLLAAARVLDWALAGATKEGLGAAEILGWTKLEREP